MNLNKTFTKDSLSIRYSKNIDQYSHKCKIPPEQYILCLLYILDIAIEHRVSNKSAINEKYSIRD